MLAYPKRLIEVDLPIKRISEHARREKSIRHGHISTLHIWWARRPLAACRAVICAALWPDPADSECPQAFIEKAKMEMLRWTNHDRQQFLSDASRGRFEQARQDPKKFEDTKELRRSLLDFIADFANWDNSTVAEYLETSRALTQAAHEALGGAPGTRPLVVDPFAGGGSIPLEALRVGADAFASDLNPIPVLLNKVVLEYIPKYGQRLADEVRKWGEWIRKEAKKELAEFYPNDSDGATPTAYLWARTIQCEGPGCGAEVPLIRALWIAKKPNRSVALHLVPLLEAKRLDMQIIVKQGGVWTNQDNPEEKIVDPNLDGTVKRGSATCRCCGYTTPVARVRDQLKARHGGANDAKLLCVVTQGSRESSVSYRLPTTSDLNTFEASANRLQAQARSDKGRYSYVPNEPTPQGGGKGAGRAFSQRHYGMDVFADLFNSRQLLALTTFASLVSKAGNKCSAEHGEEFGKAVCLVLATALGKLSGYLSSLCMWRTVRSCVAQTFGRQAIPIIWDFGEMNPFAGSAGDWGEACHYLRLFIEANTLANLKPGTAERANALVLPLPDDSAVGLFTDPPYYDAVPYADLSDYFYVWHKRALQSFKWDLLENTLTPKDDECIVDDAKGKDRCYFERSMRQAMSEARRVLAPNGIGTVVFAHKSTAGWVAQLQAMIDAEWIVTGSWPVDTERPGRLRANDSAALASSVHLVCRPREHRDGSAARTDEVGDWRDVLLELPRRIHEWMPRLAEEGVVGADAIFACLGPALEVFSRYSRVEKASGEPVTLTEYLEQVWAAVAKEALTMIFTGADATGFEEDGRLTAMWLWTLKGAETNGAEVGEDEAEPDEESAGGKSKLKGFTLEYDAARKIAQGLGAHLEDLQSLIEISGETARLLPVTERANHLFGKDEGKAAPVRRKREPQMDLFKAMQKADSGSESTFGETKVERVGATVLDRIHQTMILFAAGRGEALKRFLVEDGAGNDQRFWRLAQALSALYPSNTEEKRWVDGVLARKKGLGF